MRLAFIIPSLFLHLLCAAQVKNAREKLYYFETKDSLIGVRNQNKKVIIQPRRHYIDFDLKTLKTPITDYLIWLDNDEVGYNEPHSFGVFYDRRGNRLFAPFMFDNGPDYISDGLMRFVKNGKIGFVNREGRIIIEAKYDYADAFNYGISWYCNGCVWKYKGEHEFVTGGKGRYINIKGDTLTVFSESANKKDQRLPDSGFIRYQFSYTWFEQQILDSFYKMPEISKAYFVNFYGGLDSAERQLHFEITERGRIGISYYHVSVFTFGEKSGYHFSPGELEFYVSSDGKKFFYYDAYKGFVPLKKWLANYIRDAKIYSKEQPGSLYKY